MTVTRAQMANRGEALHSPEFSRIIAGFWRVKHWGMSDQTLLAFIERVLELGISSMDHAMVYGSEEPFGKALALKPALRSEMEIITKCGIRPQGFGELGAQAVNHYDSSKEHIIASLENSLRMLQTDYVDLLLIHRPDFLMRAEEVAEAFEQLKAQGKVRAFGVSNFTLQQFELLQAACGGSLITNQVEFSPLNMQSLDEGLLDQCQRHGVGPMLWSCLAGGALFKVETEQARRVVAALNTVKEEVNADCLEQVVYAWTLALPCNAFPLLGTSKIERVEQAVKSEKIKLNREQWYRIWEASKGFPVP